MKAKGFLKKYRNDLLLVGGLVVLIAVLFFVFRPGDRAGSAVTVEENGRMIASFPISEDLEYSIRTEAGENRLVIRDGEAWIESADCRDKICVRRGKIRNSGETIVCLPHRIVVTVTEGGAE